MLGVGGWGGRQQIEYHFFPPYTLFSTHYMLSQSIFNRLCPLVALKPEYLIEGHWVSAWVAHLYNSSSTSPMGLKIDFIYT